jgi:hypothetical protein
MNPIYERHHERPIDTAAFARRLLTHGAIAMVLIGLSLAIGMLGYTCLEGMTGVDAFLNAAMILGGMGPVKTEGLSEAGKVFAGLYALYSGLAFIAVMGLMLAPVIHRVLHRFHWSERAED